MLEAKTIYQGDTPVWHVGHDTDGAGSMADLTAGYTCRVRVVGTAIDRAVTDQTADHLNFVVALTKVETAALAAGNYILAIQIENAGAAFTAEDQGILTVKTQAIEGVVDPVISEVDALKAELAQVRAGRIALMTGGVVQKVRNGRYATEIWYATASLSDYNMMIATLEREIAAADRIAGGGTRRSAISVVWN
ncbi:gpW family head-tail joining protein [Novosphingobium sp.]|uniref:gpW family head-tail joining protein n=1 Tax=Novosphingobium sp. TaxID=1874826 RepID=UPI00286E4152|nr:gpW family head-tail joining protein [Novosphingobium sp.]